MPLPHPRPWKIIDTGSAFKITDANGRALAFVYYRRDGTLPEYMTVEEARNMAKAIARARGVDPAAGKPPGTRQRQKPL